MLLPDNIHPENTIYFNGALVLEALKEHGNQKILNLYYEVKKIREISFSLFILCLDWLYLIDIAKLNDNGDIELCS